VAETTPSAVLWASDAIPFENLEVLLRRPVDLRRRDSWVVGEEPLLMVGEVRAIAEQRSGLSCHDLSEKSHIVSE